MCIFSTNDIRSCVILKMNFRDSNIRPMIVIPRKWLSVGQPRLRHTPRAGPTATRGAVAYSTWAFMASSNEPPGDSKDSCGSFVCLISSAFSWMNRGSRYLIHGEMRCVQSDMHIRVAWRHLLFLLIGSLLSCTKLIQPICSARLCAATNQVRSFCSA